jgi:N-methylhydantoinase A/oxoprolinase/acetone carboxylase beta subunit
LLMRTYRISADCGGTFTDGIPLSDTHQAWAAKADVHARAMGGVHDCA